VTDDYRLGKTLGQGAYGVVMKATRLRDNRDFAIKEIVRDKA
jgi:serine/threonine protein kinase